MSFLKLFQRTRRFLGAILIATATTLIVIAVSKSTLVETWELKTYDTRMGLVLRATDEGRRTRDERRGTRDEKAVSSVVNRPSSIMDVVLFYVDEPSLTHFKEMGISWP